MRPTKINNPKLVAAQIEGEIRKRPEGRYFHRLHIVLLLARGVSVPKVAELYGKSIRTVQRWAKAINTCGLSGLIDDDRPGRPTRLTPEQLNELRRDIEQGPSAFGFTQGFWDGPLLSYHIKEKYGVTLKVRRCQILFHELGYTLLRPRTNPSGASPQAIEAFKKTARGVEQSEIGRASCRERV